MKSLTEASFLSAPIRSLSLLDAKRKWTFVAILCGRVSAQVFDLVGIIFVGFLVARIALGDRELPAALSGFTDALGVGSALSPVAMLVVTIGFFLAKALVGAIFLRIQTSFFALLESDFSNRSLRYFFAGDIEVWDKFSKGQIQWHIMEGPQKTFSLVLFSFSALIAEGALLFFTALLLLIVNLEVALSIFVSLGLAWSFFHSLQARRIRLIGDEIRANQVSAASQILDIIKIFPEIRAAGVASKFVDAFLAKRSRLARLWSRQRFFLGLPRYVIESAVMLAVGTLVLYFYLGDSLSDNLPLIGIFLAGGFRMVGSLLPLQNAITELKLYSSATHKAFNFYKDMTEGIDSKGSDSLEAHSKHDLPKFEQSGPELALHIQNVSYRYPNSEVDVISNFSMKVAKGQFVGIVGKSGAGKSTLVKLILGLIRPAHGTVAAFGSSLSEELLPEDHSVGYVPQFPGLLDGTIAENVSLELLSESIDQSKVWSALEKAGLSEEVSSLEGGIHCRVGGLSDKLSGGQIQRLGLARALYREPDLLVLDEITSSLDSSNADMVRRLVKRLKGSTTILAISHDHGFLVDADYVVSI